MSLKTANYLTIEAVEIHRGYGSESITIPQGTFVKPIEFCYVPKHVRDDMFNHNVYNKDTHIYCYSSYGMYPILRTKIREVN